MRALKEAPAGAACVGLQRSQEAERDPSCRARTGCPSVKCEPHLRQREDADERCSISRLKTSSEEKKWGGGALLLHLNGLFWTSNLRFLFILLFLFWFGPAGEEEEDQERDQDPGKPARRDQHNPAGGHRQRPSGRSAQCPRHQNFFIF